MKKPAEATRSAGFFVVGGPLVVMPADAGIHVFSVRRLGAEADPFRDGLTAVPSSWPVKEDVDARIRGHDGRGRRGRP